MKYLGSDETHAYFAAKAGIARSGSTAPELITDEIEFLGMTIVDGNIYGANSNTYLATMPLAGGTPTTLSTPTCSRMVTATWRHAL